MDPWAGGICETHPPSSELGPLFTNVWTDMFTRLCDSDRFYFRCEGNFPQDILDAIPTDREMKDPSFSGSVLQSFIPQKTNLTEDNFTPGNIFDS